MRTDCKQPILRFAFSALVFAANKKVAKHISFFNRRATNCELIVREMHKTLLYLTPNAPMSGAEVRSTEASAPLAG